jgi:hypothetical protein
MFGTDGASGVGAALGISSGTRDGVIEGGELSLVISNDDWSATHQLASSTAVGKS